MLQYYPYYIIFLILKKITEYKYFLIITKNVICNYLYYIKKITIDFLLSLNYEKFFDTTVIHSDYETVGNKVRFYNYNKTPDYYLKILKSYNCIEFNFDNLQYSNNEHIDYIIHNLPEHLEKIIIISNYDLEHNIFLKELFYTYLIVNLPPKLTFLNTGNKFNFTINLLSSNLKYLIIGDSFNQPIDSLPENLKYLSIGRSFNQPIDSLPENLKYLSIDKLFNQPINNLPDTITELRLIGNFNQSVDNLPKSLNIFVISGNFNQSVDNLPKSLKIFNVSGKFNQPIDNLPQTLEIIILSSDFDQSLDNLPGNINKIIINCNLSYSLENLPFGIKSIEFYRHSNYLLELKNLPDSVEYIKLPFDYDKKIVNIPKNLKKIMCSNKYKYIDDFINYEILFESLL